METKLKIAVNQFYIGKYMNEPMMSDIEFDTLALRYEAETGKSVKSLIEWEDGLTMENTPIEPLEKFQVKDNNLRSAIEGYLSSYKGNYYITYKYDGCSIKAYYKNGKLQKILGTPDEKFGIVRTEIFMNLFPEFVDPSIVSLQGEVIVDAKCYGKLARNAANGLTNSKYKASEVANEAFIRVYLVEFEDGDWTLDRNRLALESLPHITETRVRNISSDGEESAEFTEDIFGPADMFDLDDIPMDSIVSCKNTVESNWWTSEIQVDGVVLYTESGPIGFKFYFTESAVTTVKEIIWNKQPNGGYAAVIQLEPITLEDKYIQKCSSNGVPKMISDQYGRGAKVRVILANTTIPKIIEVIEPSDDFQFPKCECGYQLTEDDIFGSTLKCGNTSICSSKVSLWLPEVAQWLLDETCWGNVSTVTEAMMKNPEWFGYAFHIDRWDPFDALIIDFNNQSIVNHPAYKAGELSGISNKIQLDQADAIQGGLDWCESMFKFSELQWDNLKVNIGSGLEVIRRLQNLNSLDNIRLYLSELQ